MSEIEWTALDDITVAAAADLLSLSQSGILKNITVGNLFASPPEIGGTTPLAGTFTTLIGTTIDGIIGSVTPAAGTFTALTATGAFTSLGIDDNATSTAITIDSSGNLTRGAPSGMLAHINIDGDAVDAADREYGIWLRSKSGSNIHQINMKGAVLELGRGGTLDTSPGILLQESPASIKMLEAAAANADDPGYGQLWIKNTTPCQLWFTDDEGTDTQIV